MSESGFCRSFIAVWSSLVKHDENEQTNFFVAWLFLKETLWYCHSPAVIGGGGGVVVVHKL